MDEDDRIVDVEDLYDDSMDGDAESALTSIGWGLDESYGYFGDNSFGDY